MNKQDIDNRFQFHPAQTSEKVAAHGSARSIFWIAANQLDNLIPDGREKSIVITKMEEAMFWANAALARPKLDTPVEKPVETTPTICGCRASTELWESNGCAACKHRDHPAAGCQVPL